MKNGYFEFLNNFESASIVIYKDEIIYKSSFFQKITINNFEFLDDEIKINNHLYSFERKIYSIDNKEYDIYFLNKLDNQQKQNKHKHLIEQISNNDSFYFYRFNLLEDKMEYISKSAEQVLDVKYSEISNMNLRYMINELLKDEWNELFNKTDDFVNNSTEKFKSFKLDHKSEKNNKWLRSAFTLYLNKKNIAEYISGTSFDITDIKNENHELKNEIKKQTDFIQQLLDGSFEIDLLKNKITIDENFASYLNKSTKYEYNLQDLSKYFIDFNLFEKFNTDISTDKDILILKIKNHNNKINSFLLKWYVTGKDEMGIPTNISANLINTKANIGLTNNHEKFSSDIPNHIINAINIGIAITDEYGNIKCWNKNFTESTGLESHEAIGEKIWDLKINFINTKNNSSVMKEQFKTEFKELLRTGITNNEFDKHDNIYEIKHKNNIIKVIEFNRNTIKTNKGYNICLSANDITGYYLYESNLKTELLIFKHLIEFTPYVYYFQDFSNSDNDFISPQIWDITGHTSQEFLDLNNQETFELIHKDDRNNFIKFHDPSIVEETKLDYAETEYRILNKSGKYIFVKEYLNIQYDHKGKPKYIYGSIRNLSESTNSLNTLAETKQQYSQILNSQLDLVITVDTQNRITFVNKAYCEFFDMDEDDLIGKSFMPLVYKDDRYKTKEEMTKLFSPPYECYIEQRVFSKNKWKWLAWNDKSIVDEEGEVEKIIGVGRDITEKKKIEEKLSRIKFNSEEIINNHPMPIIISDIESKIIYKYNKSAKVFLEKNRIASENFKTLQNMEYLKILEELDEEMNNTEFIFENENEKHSIYVTKLTYNDNPSLIHIISKL